MQYDNINVSCRGKFEMTHVLHVKEEKYFKIVF